MDELGASAVSQGSFSKVHPKELSLIHADIQPIKPMTNDKTRLVPGVNLLHDNLKIFSYSSLLKDGYL
jgi:hypothetical protein